MEKSQLHEGRPHGTAYFPMEFFETTNENGQLYVNLHWHRNLEILLIHKGTCRVTVSHTEYAAQAGDIFIINQEALHRIDSDDPALSYGAYIFPLHALSFSSEDCAERSLRQLLEGQWLFPSYISAADPLSHLLSPLLDSILAAQTEKFNGYALFIKAQLMRFIAELMKENRLVRSEGAAAVSGERKNERLKQILAFINTHCSSALSLSVLASEFHISEKYFSRYFIAASGQTFTEYLNRCRIEKACRLLRETDMSVLDISMEAGYENISYFIRVFRRQEGCTPLQYRKQFSD
ncbi:MAG: AraC family transcriptional regulator [Ruminococcus sp.]